MLDVLVKRDRIHFGERLVVSFHRTLRLPDDGRTYPLPAGLGLLPIVAWQHDGRDELLVPLYRREALWLGFSGAIWQPNALKVMVGGINAVSGLPDEAAALGAPQDYLVCPLQPWLDGFNAGDGTIRQFVAMPLGEGYAIEAGHGLPERGGLRLVAYEPRPGRFPDEPPPAPRGPVRFAAPQAAAPHAMVLGAGGRMRQKIYPDPQGADAWDPELRGEARVALVAAPDFALLTGRAPPPTPIDSETYARAGLPWFDLYDEAAGSVGPAGGAGPPNNWTPAQIHHNVLDKYSVDQVRGTRFDPRSIMLYFFPGTWTVSGTGTEANEVLSDTDKAFAARMYPKQATAPGATRVEVGGAPVSAAIGEPGEEDLFAFTVAQPGRHVITTNGRTDVVMKLFGPDSRTLLVAEDDDGGEGLNPRIAKSLAPGEYLVQIRHFNRERGTGDYAIRVTR